MDAAIPSLWQTARAAHAPKSGLSEIVPEPPYREPRADVVDGRPVRGGAGPLGNNVVSATPPRGATVDDVRAWREEVEREKGDQLRREGRALRYHLRRVSSWMTKRSNVGKCGRCRYLESSVGVQVRDGRANFTGLVHCGSAWECPVCMYTISARRAEEVRTAVARHRATGGGAYMLTLTLPHDAGDDLKPLRQHVTRAWSKVQAGAPYKRMKQRLGIVGTIRALEVTHGPHGWHPHLHVLVLTAAPLEDRATGKLSEYAIAYRRMVFQRWTKWITTPNQETGKRYRAPTAEHGVTFVQSHKDEYIAKLGLADELTRGSWKKGDHARAHRTPLQILQDIWRASKSVARGSERDRALWSEYADNMYRAKQLTWSKGLRKMYDLGEEQTDLEIVDEETQKGQLVGFVRSELWDKRLKWNVDLQLRILTAAERGGVEGMLREIDRLDGLPTVPF